MSPLEARYRRLLAVYPRDHRARHEEEMIGVLLAGAPPGRTRPHPADAADLLWGALLVHGRRAFGPVSAPAWRAGLALAVALWPFLMLTSAMATQLLSVADSVRYVGLAFVQPISILLRAEPIVVAALPVLAVLLGRRWIAALGVVLFVLYQAGGPRFLDLDTLLSPNGGSLLLAQIAAVAIAFAPAAHRAIRVIPRRALLLWGPLAVAGLTASKAIVRWVDVIAHPGIVTWKPVPWLVVAGLAAGYACRSAVGRRAALLLFPPAAALGDLGDLPSVPTATALAQLGCAALAFTAAVTVTRRRRGQRRAPAS
ncbi:hypothetical protein Sme01_64590 [Sphaerisporangium melleum]|uniref:Uncharacterized protein n=1 Tax=Sphaerisporangium melleum TaxID=321316 RepID=A0A917RE35_9ACTN|nr:hypothetical protein [Sphaerisporangium melleum]GGL04070.1 hypothetical protein GCM10007964_52720 [Sphaerisporangium melleum]GII73983.1 hypothetical protein Sme01_64590 [Sphaerisporangium melleum]